MVTSDYRNIELNSCAIALGKFQGLHKGHMLLVDEITRIAKRENIKSVVFSINMQTEKVINIDEEREEILSSMNVDYKADCLFTEEFARALPEEFVKIVLVDRFHAKYVVVGEDFKFGAKRAGDVSALVKFGEKYDFKVISFEKVKFEGDIISTSLLRELIADGNVLLANKMMGRPYHITGVVVEGKKLGRTIGFPTANIVPYANKFLPKMGVYKTQIMIDNVMYRGMTNVGHNPTVDGTHGIFVETHLIDYNGDLYGKKITVRFLEFIREQKKFSDISELTAQLKEDKLKIMK